MVGTKGAGLFTCLPDWVIFGSSVTLSASSESESPPSLDIASSSDSSSSLKLSDFIRFLFVPARAPPLPLPEPLPFPVADPPAELVGVPAVGRGAIALPPIEVLPAAPALCLLPIGGVGISIFIEVFMPIMTLRFMSSYPGGVPVKPIEERLEPPAREPEPDWIRLRIISVAAENWGTYLGGESVIVVSPVPGAPGLLGGDASAMLDRQWDADEICAGAFQDCRRNQYQLKIPQDEQVTSIKPITSRPPISIGFSTAEQLSSELSLAWDAILSCVRVDEGAPSAERSALMPGSDFNAVGNNRLSDQCWEVQYSWLANLRTVTDQSGDRSCELQTPQIEIQDCDVSDSDKLLSLCP